MKYRKFGRTDLMVSEIGFGAWAIGGPAMAGNIPIGWGDSSDAESTKALEAAFDAGINFYDTADFYGLGHSEKLIGEVFRNQPNVIIASKVGHRLNAKGEIFLDYSGDYIRKACEASLKRLKRDAIDFYQLHTAKVADLEQGECIEAMESLKKEGKIRYWGVSLHTFDPEAEGTWLLERKISDGLQVVLNILNQRALPIIRDAEKAGMGIIARMPLQFGLLTGKFSRTSTFNPSDHRSFRLTTNILNQSLDALERLWPLQKQYNCTKTAFALGYVLSYSGVSTVIPGIRNVRQALENTTGIPDFQQVDLQKIEALASSVFNPLVDQMK